MARPKKCRRICASPKCVKFLPLKLESDQSQSQQPEIVLLTLDEFETIRLIDTQGLSQEECAKQMDVARTTVQSVYAQARKKLGDCIVNGKALQIEGGRCQIVTQNSLCSNNTCTNRPSCTCPKCKKNNLSEQTTNN